MQTSLILNLGRCSNSNQKRKRLKEHENETKHEYLGMRWTILKKGWFWLYRKNFFFYFLEGQRETLFLSREIRIDFSLFFFFFFCVCVCVWGVEIDKYMMMGCFGLVEQKGLREKRKKKRRGWWFHDQIMKSWMEKKEDRL